MDSTGAAQPLSFSSAYVAANDASVRWRTDAGGQCHALIQKGVCGLSGYDMGIWSERSGVRCGHPGLTALLSHCWPESQGLASLDYSAARHSRNWMTAARTSERATPYLRRDAGALLQSCLSLPLDFLSLSLPCPRSSYVSSRRSSRRSSRSSARRTLLSYQSSLTKYTGTPQAP